MKLSFFAIVLFIACITGFSSDVYISSIDTIATDFAVNITYIQNSLSLFLISVAASQMVYGPISEGYGRRKTLLMGCIITFIGSIVCITAPSIKMLYLGRLIQGAGCGSFAALWRSIFRDRLLPIQIAQYGGYLGIAMVFVVAIAPAIGAFLDTFFSWRASFAVIAFYSISLFVCIYYFLPETALYSRAHLSITFFKNAYKQLFKSPLFMGFSLCVFFTYGAFFCWYTIGPVIFIQDLHLSPKTFAWINLATAGSSMTLASVFNGRFVKRIGSESMLKIGWGLMCFAGLALAVMYLAALQTVAIFIAVIFVFLFGTTLIWPNAFSKAFAPFGHIAGYAGALYSFMQLSGGSILSFLSTLLPTPSLASLSSVIIACTTLSCVTYSYVEKYCSGNNKS